MNTNRLTSSPNRLAIVLVAALLLTGILIVVLWFRPYQLGVGANPSVIAYQPRVAIDTSGFTDAMGLVGPRTDATDLAETAQAFTQLGHRNIPRIDAAMANAGPDRKIEGNLAKAVLYSYEGVPKQAYQCLQAARTLAESAPELAAAKLYTIIYMQGIVSLRLGEDENCLMCRGEGACVLPILPAAFHTMPEGSERAIRHFREYLQQFPDDLEVRWLLNVAHMTLGEHPHKVDKNQLIALDSFLTTEHSIGAFTDIAHLVGLKDRLNHAGGAVMEDFDNDGLLDIIVTAKDPTTPMAFFRNKGDGAFEDVTVKACLANQFGGINCVQRDFNNDGHMDLIIVRGAWIQHKMRLSLLKNNGNGTFTDVTKQAGLWGPINSHSAAWIDFNNDGHLDLFVCCDQTPNRLYLNNGNGTFEDFAAKAGVEGRKKYCKGATWLDYDGLPDLFTSYLGAPSQLFHNNGNGTFTEVTKEMGIDGPAIGFSSWAFDFDNDGFLDIYVTCYDRSLGDIVKGMIGQPHARDISRLYRNVGGKKFVDVTMEMGLDRVFATMGSNFADFDNDGYLDFYLATGDPDLATLVPNRMFKNLAGKGFADISASSRTGHLQKGHGVACGDWDRDGNVDMFVELGGATPGDRFRNALFQNPGHDHNWLTVKLIGVKTNKAALGVRIKAITNADTPLTIHRHITSGSTFGGNPLQQTLGLAKATKLATLEIYWPTSKTTQVFTNVPVDQAIEITEFAKDYRKLDWKRVPVPK
ncbi:MAG: CRTAC1 family protein [Gemmataceae bacterium]|nr:CRTAC1 family protein [Gemmataceae bacterium]